MLKSKLILSAMTIGSLAVTGAANAATQSTDTTATPLARHERGNFKGFMGNQNNSLATFLKISPADLQTDLKAGKKLTDIATAQGITADQLNQYFADQRTAMISNLKTKLAAEVASGKITQAQMDAMVEKMSSAPTGTPGQKPAGNNGRFGKGGPGGHGPQDDTALATFLGIDQATLQADLKAGKKIEDIATAQGKTADQLKQFFTNQEQARLADMKTKLAADVASGKITQAQMDAMVARMSNPPKFATGQHGRGGAQKPVAPTTATNS